jgi:hypothetical protein
MRNPVALDFNRDYSKAVLNGSTNDMPPPQNGAPRYGPLRQRGSATPPERNRRARRLRDPGLATHIPHPQVRVDRDKLAALRHPWRSRQLL